MIFPCHHFRQPVLNLWWTNEVSALDFWLNQRSSVKTKRGGWLTQRGKLFNPLTIWALWTAVTVAIKSIVHMETFIAAGSQTDRHEFPNIIRSDHRLPGAIHCIFCNSNVWNIWNGVQRSRSGSERSGSAGCFHRDENQIRNDMCSHVYGTRGLCHVQLWSTSTEVWPVRTRSSGVRGTSRVDVQTRESFKIQKLFSGAFTR